MEDLFPVAFTVEEIEAYSKLVPTYAEDYAAKMYLEVSYSNSPLEIQDLRKACGLAPPCWYVRKLLQLYYDYAKRIGYPIRRITR